VTWLNRSSGTNRKRWLLGPLAVCVLTLLFPLAAISHEPVTTNVRFNKEIIRILDQKCVVCHRPGGIKSDIPLSTFEEARPWAKAIKEEILEKRMPPYQAVKGFGAFHTDYGLSQRETDLIVSWVEGGAPKGDEKDLPPRPSNAPQAWSLGKPDLVLKSDVAQLAAGASGTRCQVIRTNFKTDQWISGFEFQPGNTAIVDRATFSLIKKPSNIRVSSCPRSPVGELLGSWVPGELPGKFPNDSARMLPAGSSIVLEIDYRGPEEPTVDQSSLALFFAEQERAKQLRVVTLRSNPVFVPANTKLVRTRASLVLAHDAEIVAIRPLPFPYASSVEVRLFRPDGTSQVLIWSRNRKLDWEPTFQTKKPVTLVKGSLVEVVAYLDNSDSNARIEGQPRTFEFNRALCDLVLASASSTRLTSTSSRFGVR
jgi:hypothetical protein